MASRRGRREVELGPFPKGINNIQKATSIPYDSLDSATNVDINDEGKIQKRPGYTQLYSGTSVHSLYSVGNLCLFVEGGNLNRLNHDNSVTTLKSGLSGLPLNYVTVNGETFYCSLGDTGKLSWTGDWGLWGFPSPQYQPMLIAASGAMEGGVYQVAVTFVGSDGYESGTPTAGSITITDGQKIVLSGIPTNVDSQYVKVYATPVNGTTLYHQMTLPAATTTADLQFLENGAALETQFLSAPPVGQFIDYYNGRVYVAQDNYLFYSEPYNYGAFDMGNNYVEYPEKIRFMKALNNGIYVGSDQVYFLRGDDPTKISQRAAYTCYPIYDTAIVVESTLFNFENIFGQAVFFWSDQGAMIGTEDGFVIPLSNRRYVPGLYDKGKSFFRQEDGISNIISSLTEHGGTSTLGASDEASATITRNGIVIG